MATTRVGQFGDAVEDSKGRTGPSSLLLGNGFSIDWNYKRFHYNSLYDDATFEGLSVAKDELSERLDTHDFEVVIERLKTAADLADLYETTDGDLPEALRADAQIVRNGLADVLARRHPNRAQELKDAEVEQARAFLAHFRDIFTVNYDLLLYWVVNRSADSSHAVPVRDGFEWPTANGPYELIWKSKPTQGAQRIFYLHGALHYFREADHRVHKLKYGLAEPLIDQVRGRIEAGEYPRVVTEGKMEEKTASIERSAYLRACHRKLATAEGTIFVHGMSLSSNDDHILRLLESEDSKVEALYVSVHGDPDGEFNDEMMRRARRIKHRRDSNGGRRLDVSFYDAASAHIWR